MLNARAVASLGGTAILLASLAAPAAGAPMRRIWTQEVLDHVSTPVAIAIEEATGMVAGGSSASAALLSTPGIAVVAGPPVRLSDDAFAQQQAEPHIAVDPTDPQHLLAGAQEGRFFDGGAVGNGSYMSTDGGATWTAAIIPDVSIASGNPAYERATDPVVAFGPDGTAWFCSLAINITTIPGAILVNRSEDGVAWSTSQVVVASETAEHFLDKQWLTIDTGVASPHSGRLYVTWSDFISPPGNPFGLKKIPINISWSDDGETWSAPKVISGGDTYNQGSQPIVAPDGTVHVIYYGFNKKDMRIVTSRDGGVTWTNPKSAARAVTGGVPGIRTAEELPAAAVDPTSGALVVAWQDTRRDGGDVMVVRSTDGGRTWTAPVIANDGPAGDIQFTPAVTIRDGVTHVSWYDSRDAGADPTIWQMRAASSGVANLTFGTSVAISAPFDTDAAVDTARGKFYGDYAGIVVAGDSVHPVWVDSSLGQNDVFSAAFE